MASIMRLPIRPMGTNNLTKSFPSGSFHRLHPERPTSIRQISTICSVSQLPRRPQSSRQSTPCSGLQASPRWARSFTMTNKTQNWLQPKHMERSKSRVGRPRMGTGGSMRGTTVVWGDYGLRMKDHDRRVSAAQLKLGEDTIRRRLRGVYFKLYTRVSANIGVYTKGNQVRMGKGKGKFDYWAARIPVSRIVFEIKGIMHEKVAREAFRLASDKLPGTWEFVKKGDAPMVGITKLGNGITLESLREARRPVEVKAEDDNLVIPPVTDEPPKTISTGI